MIVIILAIFALVKGENIVRVSLGSADVEVTEGNNLPDKYQPLLADDKAAISSAWNWVDNMTAQAKTHVDSLPKFDPFLVEDLPPINIDHSLISGEIKLRNLNITGLKVIFLNELEIRTKNKRLDIVLAAPALTGEADYEADINLGFLPVTYSGHARIWLKGIKITGAGNAVRKRYNGEVVYQMGGINAAIQIDDIQIDIDKSLWDTVTGVMPTSQILQELAKGAVSAFWTQANIALRRYSTKTVEEYIRPYVHQ